MDWAYCAVSLYDNECVTDPKYDSLCPKQKPQKRISTFKYPSGRTSKPKPIPEPPEQSPTIEKSKLSVQLTSDLTITCPISCKNPIWESLSSGQNKYHLLQNKSIVLTLGNSHEEFQINCTCSDQNRVHVYQICPTYTTGCQLTKNGIYARVTKKNCQATMSKCMNGIKTESETNLNYNEVEIPYGGNTNALNAGSEGCSGYCGFCKTNPVMCGVVFVCVGSLLVVISINLLNNARWKKIATYLRKNGSTTDAATSRNDFGGFYQFKNCRPEPHYDHALNICRRFEEPKEVHDATITQLPASLFSTLCSKPKTNFAKITSNEFNSINSLVCHSSPNSDDTPIKILVTDEGGTMFDKYYDVQVESWSVCSDMESHI